MKYNEDKKAKRESETHKEKIAKEKRSANKPNHRDKPRNMRGEVVANVANDVGVEQELTVVG